MAEQTIQVSVPQVGWRGVQPFCGECLHVISHNAQNYATPGQQFDCGGCHNRVTAVSTAEVGPDYSRSLWNPGPAGTTTWKLAGVLFSTQRRSLHSRASWLAARQFDEFQKGDHVGVEWQTWQRPNWGRPSDPDKLAYFVVEDGVLGFAEQCWAPAK